MHMLYNSDAFAVVRFDHEGSASPADAANSATAGTTSAPNSTLTDSVASAAPAVELRGFEIVDKRSRKEIFLSGVLAQSFQQGAQALSETNPTPEQWDDYIEGFTTFAQQPLVMH